MPISSLPTKVPAIPSSSRCVGGGVSKQCRPSSKNGSNSNNKNVQRAVGPQRCVLRKHEAKILTEHRARALLDTVPEKLVGLTYQELHRAHGGWWETKVTEILYDKGGVGVATVGVTGGGGGGSEEGADGGGGSSQADTDMDPRWPSTIVVEQKDPKGESTGTFSTRRKVRVLLQKLKAWDKQRLEMWQEQEEQEEQRETRRRPAAQKVCGEMNGRLVEFGLVDPRFLGSFWWLTLL